jgi:hypothetical protein
MGKVLTNVGQLLIFYHAMTCAISMYANRQLKVCTLKSMS